MLRHVPERREQFNFIGTRHERHRRGGPGGRLKILGGEQHLAPLRVGIEHANTDDLRGEWPEAELPQDFLALRGARWFLGDFIRFAQQILLLHFIEVCQRERGGFDVENKFGHGIPGCG